MLPASCLFVFSPLFDSEDGGDMFPWNGNWFSPEGTALYARIHTLYGHLCENLNPNNYKQIDRYVY
jgi:hypothetical protein